MLRCSLLLVGLLPGVVLAQPAPPALPPAAAGEAPRAVITLPAPPAAPGAPATPLTEPDADEQLPPAREALTDTRIEQRRQSNRIVEVTVTPPGGRRSYSMTNREGERPRSPQELSAGLSLPNFFKLDF